MNYQTMLVHLELGRSNTTLLHLAGNLAERFHASLTGIAACPPLQMIYGDVYVPGDTFACEPGEIAQEIGKAEAEFRSALRERSCALSWRSAGTFADVAEFVSRQARCADLVITGAVQGDLFDASRDLGPGALIMQCGRPVLVVPPTLKSLAMESVLVAWKDTRETRRAIADALPLMREAADVAVVEIAAKGHMDAARRHLDDVVGWLRRHDIEARGIALPGTGDDAADLRKVADQEHSEIIVAGAYGHSRMREWMLGGVTRDLLLTSGRCALLSH